MNCRFEHKNVMRRAYCVLRNLFARRATQDARRTGFTLVESMAAVALLAFIGTSVWVVMDRCMISAADSTQRMRAFEIARENMEKLLGSASVTESTEYGVSEKFPDIRWRTTVESFYEPITSHIWVRAVCSAEYSDSAGENQSVELTHWLTDLTKAQLQELMRRKALKEQILAEHIIETEDLAAEYAGVNIETVRQWVLNGMPVTENGEYLKPWLDLYLQTDGSPTEEENQYILYKYPELASIAQTTNPDQQAESQSELSPQDDAASPDNLDAELEKFEKSLEQSPGS
ncbi:MAG: prepilin-type N-terminal cleavage/methylation domain-containing protein [Planctomycetota bacterium]